MTPIPTVGVLIIKDNKVLLVKHGEKASHVTGVYGWPGGRIDKDESSIQAAIRELEEETGLVAKASDVIPFGHELEPAKIKRKNGEQLFSAELFVCNAYTGSLRATEETIPKWVDLAKVASLNLLPNVKFVIDTIVKERMDYES